jgi:diguanylate cyclase (GGDEF)-like protein
MPNSPLNTAGTRAILLVADEPLRTHLAEQARALLGNDASIVETSQLPDGIELPSQEFGDYVVIGAESEYFDSQVVSSLCGRGLSVIVWLSSESPRRAREYLETGALDVVLPSRADVDLYRALRAASAFEPGLLDRPKACAIDSDPSATLPTRVEFQRQLSQLGDQVSSHAAVILVGVDEFKAINRSLGHAVGDEVLRAMIGRLRSCVRNADALARWGCDEFVCLLGEQAGTREVEIVAKRILYSLSRPLSIESRALYVSASVGIATADGEIVDNDELVRRAETAMHLAQRAGGNFLRFYDPEMDAGTSQRLETAGELRDALRNEEFELFYQPIVDVESNSVSGVEALIRWNDREGNLRMPGEFIPILESTMLIIDVGVWGLRKACTQVRAWQYSGLSDLKVSVNLSPRQFRHGDVEKTVVRALEETGLSPSSLQLELTESVLMDEPEKARAVLGEIRKLGVKVALDDFGTGHSSLAMLRNFPVDTLKVDRQFVKDIHESEDARAMCSAILQLGRALKLEVVAEGVELSEQARLLADEQCRYIQGFLYARPMPAEQTWSWLTEEIASPLVQNR